MKLASILCVCLTSFAYAATLDFTSILQEIHAPADAPTVTADFAFTNHSKKSVTISKSDPGCSCLKVQISGGKLKYAPGESGTIRATFDMGNFSGTVDKMIALWLDNDPPDKPSMSLTVRVHIPILVGVEPKTVKWEIGAKPEAQTIKIRMADEKPIRVTAIKNTSESFSCELKTVTEGKEYELVVTPLVIDSAGIGVIRIETDCRIPKHRIQQAFAVVRKATSADTPAKP